MGFILDFFNFLYEIETSSPLTPFFFSIGGFLSIFLYSKNLISYNKFKIRNIFWLSANGFFIVFCFTFFFSSSQQRYDAIPLLFFYLIFLFTAHLDIFWQNRLKRSDELRGLLEQYLDPVIIKRILGEHQNIILTQAKENATILFADIRGFTKISEKSAPEKLVSQLNEFLDAMSAIVREHRGMIDKFIGDSIMAVFLEESPNKRSAENAILAAIKMMRTLKKFNLLWLKSGTVTLKIGIGISVGEVFLGNVGSRQHLNFTAIGDTVNVASRLSSIADADEILGSGGTENFNSATISYKMENLGLKKLKGREGEVPVHRIIYEQVKSSFSCKSARSCLA